MQNFDTRSKKKKTKKGATRNGTVTLAGRAVSTNISAYVAKQKAGVCMLLHYGQSFSFDEATFEEIAQRLCWIVPVWVLYPRGRAEREARGIGC